MLGKTVFNRNLTILLTLEYLNGAAETGCLTWSTAVGPSQHFSSPASFSMTVSDAEQTASTQKQSWEKG